MTRIGGIIANIDEEGKDKGNLTLSYGSLRTANIESHDKLINLNGNIEINQRSRDNNTELVLNNKKGKNKTRDNVKEVPNRVDETYGVGVEGHEREKITRAEEMLKDVNVQKTEFIFKSEPNSWGDFNKIMSSNAGIIGNFLDDMNEHTGNKVRTNYEDKFRTKTNEIISKVEKPLDKVNRFISILPTSGTHGGILEQIVRTVRYDKTPIVKIGIEKNKEDGTVMVGMEEIRKISDYKSKDGKPVKVNTNGIIELKENAVRNTIFKNMTKEDMDRYNRGERVEMLMVYNPTRGAVADIIESALGKMFDGSWSSLGLSIGVNRGAAVAYASRDKNQSYDFSFYSQGKIIGLGAFNILKNNGIKLGNGAENFNVRMYGTPIAIKSYQNFEGVLGINVLGAAVNEPDFVGSNGKWAGLIGERRPILGTGKEDIARLKATIKDSKLASEIPVLKAILREEPGAVLPLPKLVSEEEKAKYESNKSEWLQKNGYSMPITSSDLDKIRANYKKEVKDDLIAEGKGKLSDQWIVKKWLNDGHGAYTYYSAQLAKDIDGLLRKYQNTGDETAKKKIQEDIENKYIENQERLIELFTQGPALMNDSKGLLAGLGEYNRVENERAYREGKYQEKNLPQNYITNSLNESIREGKLGVMDINEYIESLRNGAGLR